jgi:predicted ribosomally synthesized peptide with nif11-like leader
MANTNVQDLLDRIETDPDLAIRMKDAGTPESIQEILRAEGFEVDGDELRDAALDRWSDQLSPEELEAIVGGDTAIDVMIVGIGLWACACILASAV